MTEITLKYYLSNAGFNVYLAKTNNDFKDAYDLYLINIELSEAFYPILTLIEISLRNAVNESLKNHFKDNNWFENHLPTEFSPFIIDAKKKLYAQNKNLTKDRIIAELNFGFWNRLFNRRNTKLLWKPLRLIFKNIPKNLKQRDTIADILFKIRQLRNRVYHYEPIFNNLDELKIQHQEMIDFIYWIDEGLPQLIVNVDRFLEVHNKTKLKKY